MKRILLIFMIIGLCIIVAISGNIALVNNNGVLKKQKKMSIEINNYHIMVDLEDKRLFLLKNDKIHKSFPISVLNINSPSPVGNWKATKKISVKDGRTLYWFSLNVPWGRYAIHGTEAFKDELFDEGSIKMFKDDIAELYYTIDKEASIYIYGDEKEQIYKTLEPGDRGTWVYEVEKKLRIMGYNVGKVDGIYDKVLKEAIHNFQRSHKLTVSNTIKYPFYKKLGVEVIE